MSQGPLAFPELLLELELLEPVLLELVLLELVLLAALVDPEVLDPELLLELEEPLLDATLLELLLELKPTLTTDVLVDSDPPVDPELFDTDPPPLVDELELSPLDPQAYAAIAVSAIARVPRVLRKRMNGSLLRHRDRSRPVRDKVASLACTVSP